MAGGEDSGVGVFGALKHLEKEQALEDALLEAAFGVEDGDDAEDEDEGPPRYMVDRQVLDGTLEEELATAPFENYQLTLGQKSGGFLGGKLRTVGTFKVCAAPTGHFLRADHVAHAVRLFIHSFIHSFVRSFVRLLFSLSPRLVAQGLVRILDHEPTSEEAPFDLQLLLKPQSYKVRLYILQATKLTPMDPGWEAAQASRTRTCPSLGKEKFRTGRTTLRTRRRGLLHPRGAERGAARRGPAGGQGDGLRRRSGRTTSSAAP